MTDGLAAPRPLVPAVEPAVPPRPERLLSLDVFRGLTVAAMLLVNNPGTWSAVYDPLEHAAWHGWTPTDLIFPFFLFIVGVSMAYSLVPRLERGDAPGRLFGRAAKRSAILIGLGLLLAAFPYYNLDLAHLRFPGVLQRIGLAFLLASAVVLFTRPRAQAVVAAALLLGYWAAMKLVPVPGYGAGEPEQGRQPGRLRGPRGAGHEPPVGVREDVGPGGAAEHAARRGDGAAGGVRGAVDALGRGRRRSGWWDCSWRGTRPWWRDWCGTRRSPSTRTCGPARTYCSRPGWRCTRWPCATGWWTCAGGGGGPCRSPGSG